MKVTKHDGTMTALCLSGMLGWMPINTAPKGIEIDVWCQSSTECDDGGYRVANAWWCEVDKKWRVAGDDRITWAHQPTHWMNIPSGPNAVLSGKPRTGL